MAGNRERFADRRINGQNLHIPTKKITFAEAKIKRRRHDDKNDSASNK
jgi:hypothetical protein